MGRGCSLYHAMPEPIIAPIEGVGSCTPTPRNPSALSNNAAHPTHRAAYAATTGKTCGTTSRAIMSTLLAPSARAASTNGRSLLTTACPYVTRASGAQQTAASATVRDETPGPST